MRLSEMKSLLAAENLQLTRSLGQCFMHDGNVLRKIVAAAELRPGDRVLEVGPGLGPLTELLLGAGARVLALEKDARLVRVLQQRFAGTPGLELRPADALETLMAQAMDWSDWKLVSNLPYSVASPILVELAGGEQPPARMVCTLQLEVAQRVVARAGSPDYGVLSLLLQARYEPGGFFRIPATCFFPQPDVDSACVTLLRRPGHSSSALERSTFVRVVKCGFAHRRKMMFKQLKAHWPEDALRKAYAAAGLDAGVRAEQVSLDQFRTLTRVLHAV